MVTFDCKTFIPDVEKLQMEGNTIIVLEHVLKKIEENKEMNRDA
jgi:excinuclease UvrABC ATPase subunit